MASFKFKAANPADDLADLLLASNPELKDFIASKHYTFGHPKEVVPSKDNGYNNTVININALPASGVLGTVPLYYNRMDLNRYLDSNHAYQPRSMAGVLNSVDIICKIPDSVTTPFIGNASQSKSDYDLFVSAMPYSGVYSSDIKFNPNKYPQDFIAPTEIIHGVSFEVKVDPKSLRYTPNSSFKSVVFFNNHKSDIINKVPNQSDIFFSPYFELRVNKLNQGNIKSNSYLGSEFTGSTIRSTLCVTFNFNFSSCFSSLDELKTFISNMGKGIVDATKVKAINDIMRQHNAPYIQKYTDFDIWKQASIVKLDDSEILYENFQPKEGFDRYVVHKLWYTAADDSKEAGWWCSELDSENAGYEHRGMQTKYQNPWFFYFPK